MAAAAEAPRTAVARIRIFIQKGLGSPTVNDSTSYFYDHETGQAHLTLYGRAFAFASQDRIEADAKEGVYRAALCRDILHTILKTFPQDRVQKFELQRLAVEWQSMATLGPLPSKMPSFPPPPAGIRPLPLPSRNITAQTPSSHSPQVSSFLPPVVAARSLGNHSIVSPSTSAKGPSLVPTSSYSNSTKDLPSLDRRFMTGAPHSQPSTTYTHFPPPSNSKPNQGVQPALPPKVPVQESGAPAALRAPAFGNTATFQATSASPSRIKETIEDDEPPDIHHPDETRAYRSLLRAEVPDIALRRIKWLCGVHLSRSKAPQVYQPYLNFYTENRTIRLIVAARTGEPYEMKLHEDELYLLESKRGIFWLQEELARQAIKHGVFTKFTKMKMPKANVKSDMFAIVTDYGNFSTLKPNNKPTRAQLEGLPGLHSPTVSTSGRPAINIASNPAIDPRNSNAPGPGVSNSAVNNTPARSNTGYNSQPRDFGTASTDVSMSLFTPTINGTSERSIGAQQKLSQPAMNGDTPTRALAHPLITTNKLSLRSSAAPEAAAVFLDNADLASKAGRLKGPEIKGAESVEPLAKQMLRHASPSRDPRLQMRTKPPLAQENKALVVAPSKVQSVEAPMSVLVDALRSMSPLERTTPAPANSERWTHETSQKTLVERTASAPQAELATAALNASMTPGRQSPASMEPLQEKAERQKPVRTPSLSERMAFEPRQSPPSTAKDQSLFSRLQSDQSAAIGPSRKTYISNSSESKATEKTGEVPLLDRLADREAELRRRMRAARRAPEHTGSKDEKVSDTVMQVDAPAERPTEDASGQVASSGATQEEMGTENEGINEMDLDRQEALQAPKQLSKAADARASAIATPEGRDTITALERGSPKLTASQVAPSSSQSHEHRDLRPILDQWKVYEQAEQAARSSREATDLVSKETAAAEGPVSLVQVVTPSARGSPEAIPIPAIPTASQGSSQQAPTPENVGAKPPSRTVQPEQADSRTSLRLDNHLQNRADSAAAEASTRTITHNQASIAATLPTRPRSGSVHSTYSGRSRGSRPESEVVKEDGRNKRPRDSGNGQLSAASYGWADDYGKRMRRSSPGPLASSSHESVVSSVGNGTDSRPSTPSILYNNAQNMASILAKLAVGALTYDQACEAMYVLSLPASLDNAAFEALEAIWANSSAQLLQQASADFGMNCKTSDLVLMPKSWVEESLELLQKEGSAS